MKYSRLTILITVIAAVFVSLFVPLDAYAFSEQVMTKDYWEENINVDIVDISKRNSAGGMTGMLKYFTDENGDFYTYFYVREASLSASSDIYAVYEVTLSDRKYSFEIRSDDSDFSATPDVKNCSAVSFDTENDSTICIINAIRFSTKEKRSINASLYINGRVYKSVAKGIEYYPNASNNSSAKSTVRSSLSSKMKSTISATTTATSTRNVKATSTVVSGAIRSSSSSKGVTDTTNNAANGVQNTAASDGGAGIYYNYLDEISDKSHMSTSAMNTVFIGLIVLGLGVLLLIGGMLLKGKRHTDEPEKEKVE